MRPQRGGFALGMVVGLLTGLALALGVALYVTKVPIPFVNKVPARAAGQGSPGQEGDARWDPNASLAGKPAVRPVTPAPASAELPAGVARAPAAAPRRDTAAVLAGEAALPPRSAQAGADAFTYYVQAGAFTRAQDAEQQRARLAMLGFTARVTEREQSGRTVYRVRVGPFEHKEQADAAQNRIAGSGVEAALVRVDR